MCESKSFKIKSSEFKPHNLKWLLKNILLILLLPKTPQHHCQMSLDGWDNVRREARRAETELGRRIESLRSLCYRVDSSTTSADGSRQQQPAVDPESNRYEKESLLCGNVEDSLSRFARVLETMQAMTLDGGTRRQTLSRYNDIYHTSKMDYAKLKTHLQRERQKMELFGSDNNESTDDPARDQLLRERRLLAEATQQGEEILSKAEAAHAGMKEQGMSLLSSSSRMANNVLARFPTIGHLVERVRRRKRRDQIIIAMLIGFLIFFTLWYLGIV